MKASLRSVRIAPKKANLVAKMVRGMPVPAALQSLEHTNKKAARLLEDVIRSAAANARQNDNQNPDDLIVKTVVVNKAITYHRGIPMARGRMRRIRKFLSHISVDLGYPETGEDRGRRTEDRGQRIEGKGQKTEDKGQEGSGKKKTDAKKSESGSTAKKATTATKKTSSTASSKKTAQKSSQTKKTSAKSTKNTAKNAEKKSSDSPKTS